MPADRAIMAHAPAAAARQQGWPEKSTRPCRLRDTQQQHAAGRDEHELLARGLGLSAGSAADDVRHEQQYLRLWRDDETRLPQRAGLYEHGPVQRRYLEQQQSEVQRDVRP